MRKNGFARRATAAIMAAAMAAGTAMTSMAAPAGIETLANIKTYAPGEKTPAEDLSADRKIGVIIQPGVTVLGIKEAENIKLYKEGEFRAEDNAGRECVKVIIQPGVTVLGKKEAEGITLIPAAE